MGSSCAAGFDRYWQSLGPALNRRKLGDLDPIQALGSKPRPVPQNASQQPWTPNPFISPTLLDLTYLEHPAFGEGKVSAEGLRPSVSLANQAPPLPSSFVTSSLGLQVATVKPLA
jgi:hypothetical protein